MNVLVVHTMHSSTIAEMLDKPGQEENYWGFLGFWNRMAPQLESRGIEVSYLLSEAFMPLLERKKAIEKLQSVRKARKFCLLEKHFNFLWNSDPDDQYDQEFLSSLSLDDYYPDIVIAHDDLKKMRALFSSSVHLGIEVGAYSRPPYPGTFYFDPYSFDCEKIVPAFISVESDLSTETLDFLAKIRSFATDTFNDVPDGAAQFLNDLRRDHTDILLFAIQYPSPRYSPYTRHESLSELVRDIALNAPQTAAIVLCPRAHNFQGLPIPEEDWRALKAAHPNLFVFPEHLTWPYYTQMLVPHVSGVIAVTSTVGLQAALWGKHWFTSPESFYSTVTPDYRDMKNCIGYPVSPRTTRYVNWMSQYFWLPNLMLSEPRLLANILKLSLKSRDMPVSDYLKVLNEELDALDGFTDSLIQCYERMDARYKRNEVIEIISL